MPYFKSQLWASLVTEWLKNQPANTGDTGSIPIWEDPSCHGAAKPEHHHS